MLRLRNIAFRLLPLVVVVWATVAVLGGTLYLARHAGPPEHRLEGPPALGEEVPQAALGDGERPWPW